MKLKVITLVEIALPAYTVLTHFSPVSNLSFSVSRLLRMSYSFDQNIDSDQKRLQSFTKDEWSTCGWMNFHLNQRFYYSLNYKLEFLQCYRRKKNLEGLLCTGINLETSWKMLIIEKLPFIDICLTERCLYKSIFLWPYLSMKS